MGTTRIFKTFIPLLVFTGSIVLANWLTTHYGFVPVGFGLTATAGTYAAGLALVSRDFVHESLGITGAAVAILLGGLISYLVGSPQIAIASMAAFVVSEFVDTLIYTPLRERRWRTAVIASSIFGAITDTILFLWIAFGASSLTLSILAGQLVGKVLWVAVPVALIGGTLRNRVPA